MQFLSNSVNIFLDPLDAPLYSITESLLLLTYASRELAALPLHAFVGLLDLLEYPLFHLGHLHGDPVDRVHDLIAHLLLHKLNPLVHLVVIGPRLVLEA